MERSKELSMDQSFLQSLKNIVITNLSNEQFGAEELAKEVGISRSQIHRKLQKINGKSITQFIREIRLEEALKLLREEVGTASEIAYRVGFSSPAYFTKCFHEFFGYPPGEVKKKKGLAHLTATDKSNIIPIHRGKESEQMEYAEYTENDDFRKLTTIMFSDISGYTAIMGDSERKALNLLKKNRKLHQSLIDLYRGKLLKEIGDAIMASFDSPSDAVHCAQQIMQVSKDEDGLKLHIGIHLGEVHFIDGDFYGDGVNLASRINSFAKEGEVLISEEVCKNVRNKENICTEEIGEKKFKNIKNPVKIYKVIEKQDPAYGSDLERSVWAKIKSIPPWRWAAIVLVFGILIVGSVNLYERIIVDPSDIPTIAVLPFENTGSDLRFDYLENGLPDGINTNLMSVAGLDVKSSRAALQFSSKDWSYAELKRILKTDYLVEGSYVVSGDIIQLMVRIVDAETGTISFSKPFENSIDNLGELQSNVAVAMVDNLNIDLSEAELNRVTDGRNINVAAYEFLQKGKDLMRIKSDAISLEESKNLLYMALQSDPKCIDAYVALGEVVFNGINYAGTDPIVGIKEVESYLEQAYNLDPEKGELYVHEGLVSIYNNNWGKARKLINKGISLSPNYAYAHLCLAWTFSVKKKHDQAIESIDKAITLDPLDLQYPFWKVVFLSFKGDYNRAEAIIEPYYKIDSLKGWASFFRGVSQVQQKDYESAANNIKQLNPWCGWMGYSSAMSGDRKNAMKILNGSLEASKERYVSPCPLSWIYIGLGEYETAFEFLEEAYNKKDNYGVFLVNSVVFDPIRDDPRFQEILRRWVLPINALFTLQHH